MQDEEGPKATAEAEKYDTVRQNRKPISTSLRDNMIIVLNVNPNFLPKEKERECKSPCCDLTQPQRMEGPKLVDGY